ncbi:MAG: hypothetical protein SGPRY_006173 [Prymnesium sp.]
MEEESEVESLLWTCKECYVYQIPPLKSESGHRANDWDVNKWLWSGTLKVVAKGNTLSVLLVDNDTGQLFASCPMTDPDSKAIDRVIDSSRYFVLRIDDGQGRHAFIGMGFRDRNFSYDFNATLQDHWKSVERQKEAEEWRAEMESRSSEQMRDLSLKDGEKLNIKVNVPGKSAGAPKKPREVGTGILAPPPGNGLLAPPPKAGILAPPPTAGASTSTVVQSTTPVPSDTKASSEELKKKSSSDEFGEFADFASAGGNADDDFGDFAAAP